MNTPPHIDPAAATDKNPGAAAEEDRPDPDVLADAELAMVLESLLLVLDAPTAPAILADVLEITEDRVAATLEKLADDYDERGSGLDLRRTAEGWRLYTRPAAAPYVEKLLLDGARSMLTRAALETLAVVAYRQPVTRARVGAVRGVNVDGVMRTLLARGLITEAGTDPDTHAVQYGTTALFLERLGLDSLTDLPPLAPLLPDVDTIEQIDADLESEPHWAKMTRRSPQKADDAPTEDEMTDDD